MLRTALLLGAVSACYSPSYTQCSITCPDGETCPSGHVCEPNLMVCVPESNPAACNAMYSDGGGRDSTGSDGAGGDASFGAFCAGSPPGFIYCQDFDSGATLPGQGWAVSQLFGGTASLVMPGFSPQWQFESATPSSGEPAEGRIKDSFVIPSNSYNQLSIFFEMQQVLRTTGSMKSLFLLHVPGSFDIEIFTNNQGLLSVQSSTAVPSGSYTAVNNAWTRYELRFNSTGGPDAGAGGLYATLWIGSGATSPAFTLGMVPRPPLAVAWEMNFGLAGAGNNSAIRYNFDNIVVYH